MHILLADIYEVIGQGEMADRDLGFFAVVFAVIRGQGERGAYLSIN